MRRSKTKLLVFSVLSLMLTSCGTMGENSQGNQNQVEDEIHATGITLKDNAITLYAGETYQIEYEITPSGATEQEVVYTVNNEDALTVSETGLITAKQYSGLTTVRVSLKDRPGIFAEIKVTTKRRTLVEEINVSVSRLDFVFIGQTKEFTYTVLPINAPDKSVDIYIEDTTIASLSQNLNEVTALKNGSTNLITKWVERRSYNSYYCK